MGLALERFSDALEFGPLRWRRCMDERVYAGVTGGFFGRTWGHGVLLFLMWLVG